MPKSYLGVAQASRRSLAGVILAKKLVKSNMLKVVNAHLGGL